MGPSAAQRRGTDPRRGAVSGTAAGLQAKKCSGVIEPRCSGLGTEIGWWTGKKSPLNYRISRDGFDCTLRAPHQRDGAGTARKKKRTRLTRRAQPYRIGHRQITTWQRHVHKHARQHVDKDLLFLGVVVPKGPTRAAAEGRAAWTAALSRAARRARTSVTPWWSRDREPRVPPAGTAGRLPGPGSR